MSRAEAVLCRWSTRPSQRGVGLTVRDVWARRGWGVVASEREQMTLCSKDRVRSVSKRGSDPDIGSTARGHPDGAFQREPEGQLLVWASSQANAASPKPGSGGRRRDPGTQSLRSNWNQKGSVP